MAQKRVSMRKTRDVLRLKYSLGRSHREIAAILRISHSTVGSYARRAGGRSVVAAAGRSGRRGSGGGAVSADATLAGAASKAGLGAGAPGVGEPQGCDASASVAGVPRGAPGRVPVQPVLRSLPGVARAPQRGVLRQVYRAGEKAFVDYAGPTVEVTDRRTGEIHEAKVFVGVLAASNQTFVDVSLPPRHLDPLLPRLPPPRRTHPRPRRRSLSQARSAACQDLAPRPRRLGPRFSVRPGPPRPARCSRRSLRPSRNHPRLPTPRRALARRCRRPTFGRRNPRPPAQPRAPHHPQEQLHEAAVRLNQGDPHLPPTTPDPSMSGTPSRSPRKSGRLGSEPVGSLARNSRTASPGTGGRLRRNRQLCLATTQQPAL